VFFRTDGDISERPRLVPFCRQRSSLSFSTRRRCRGYGVCLNGRVGFRRRYGRSSYVYSRDNRRPATDRYKSRANPRNTNVPVVELTRPVSSSRTDLTFLFVYVDRFPAVSPLSFAPKRPSSFCRTPETPWCANDCPKAESHYEQRARRFFLLYVGRTYAHRPESSTTVLRGPPSFVHDGHTTFPRGEYVKGTTIRRHTILRRS